MAGLTKVYKVAKGGCVEARPIRVNRGIGRLTYELCRKLIYRYLLCSRYTSTHSGLL